MKHNAPIVREIQQPTQLYNPERDTRGEVEGGATVATQNPSATSAGKFYLKRRLTVKAYASQLLLVLANNYGSFDIRSNRIIWLCNLIQLF